MLKGTGTSATPTEHFLFVVPTFQQRWFVCMAVPIYRNSVTNFDSFAATNYRGNPLAKTVMSIQVPLAVRLN